MFQEKKEFKDENDDGSLIQLLGFSWFRCPVFFFFFFKKKTLLIK